MAWQKKLTIFLGNTMKDTIYKIFNKDTGRYYDPKDSNSVTGKVYRSIKNAKIAISFAKEYLSDYEIHEFKVSDYLVVE